MKVKEKIAIARIFTDIIKADRIVNIRELGYWEKICSKYSIDKDIEVRAQGTSFADALSVICESDISGLRKDLLEDCRSMTLSDGFCAHSEALIMVALILMLDDRRPYPVEVMSIPQSSFNIDIATALYIESDFDEPANTAIRTGYRSIYKEFQLAGFHFVYLPHIIKHYRETDPALFRKMLSFLAPYLSESGIDHTYRSLMKMTTGSFCKDLLCNKLGIGILRSTRPSLMIKIGNSFVGEISYSNYLKVEVDEDVVSTVQNFVDRFCELLSSDVYVVRASEERATQYHFHGFYKQLLDIFLIRKNIRSSIVLDPYKEEILFPEIDSKAVGLHRRERALYAMLLCSGATGVDFNSPGNASGIADFNKRMDSLNARYRELYSMFGGDKSSAPDLSLPEIRRPIFSCLKRSIRNLSGLYNPDDYNVSKSHDGIFSVHIEPELIFVKELHSSEPVPLKDSDLYRRWLRV